ncbi:hypothetical protein B0T22DRAFT_12264 [Podospora appendiculata]|uniref:Uncharacterized protein n=1 Tax=Podospora appendiculata TaxID=314037 RepID=A0AAE0XFA9_9PEZI|nr:hypothetical protein B0T22DRAFT_12264 [Podospora appendiculata]
MNCRIHTYKITRACKECASHLVAWYSILAKGMMIAWWRICWSVVERIAADIAPIFFLHFLYFVDMLIFCV